jgi:N-acetylglucosamine-6-sulfatase
MTIPNGTRNTYKTLRVIGEDYGYLYSHWCTNETDFYDTVVSLTCFRR